MIWRSQFGYEAPILGYEVSCSAYGVPNFVYEVPIWVCGGPNLGVWRFQFEGMLFQVGAMGAPI